MAGNMPFPGEKDVARIVQAVRELFMGRSNAVGTVTLRASETTTTVTAINCGPDSKIFLMPTTANASADFPDCYISAVAAGSFTITHPSDADEDKTFHWVALG